MDRQDIANTLAGTQRLEDTSKDVQNNTQTISGKLVEDTADGVAKVYISDNVTQPDDYDDDGTIFEIPTSVSGEAGDDVLITTRGKRLSIPMVTANPGFGDKIKALAKEAQELAEAINQYFWNDTNGVHVSTEADVATGAHNILLNSYGLLLRAASNYLAALTASGVTFYNGQGNTDTDILAAFTNIGAQIGALNNTHMLISDHDLQILNGKNQVLTGFDTKGWYRYNPTQQYPDDDDTKPQNPGYDPDNPSTLESFIGEYAFELSNVRDKLTFGDTIDRYYWNPRAGSQGEWSPIASRLVELEVLANQGSTLSLKALDSDSQGVIDIHSDNTVDVTGDIYLPNGKAVYGADSNGTNMAMVHSNADNIHVGYGSYNGQVGSTNIWGKNIILTPRNRNTFNGTNVMNTCGGCTNDDVYRNIWHMSNGTNLVIGYGWYVSSQRAYTTELQGNNLKLTHAAAFTVNGIDYANTNWVTGANNCYYRKRAGWVCVLIDSRTWSGTTITTIFTLPAGYRPSYKIHAPSVNVAASHLGKIYVVVETNGAVRFSRDNANVSSSFNCFLTFPIA